MITYTVAGITLKLADHYGEGKKDNLQYVFAIISSISFGLLISSSQTSSAIIFGIIVGVFLARKIDRPNLVLGFILTLITAWVLGFNIPSLWLLVVVSILSLTDEICHEKFISNIKGLACFFRFRPFLKLGIVVLAILSHIEAVYSIGFLSFDFAYEITNLLLNKGSSVLGSF